MKIMKFGGTSVGSPERMKNVASLITADEEQKIVVLSAVSGTTNKLVEIGELWKNDDDRLSARILDLKKSYWVFCDELYSNDTQKKLARMYTDDAFDRISEIVGYRFSEQGVNEILSKGELLSTHLFHYYLNERSIENDLLNALKIVHIDDHHEPDYGKTQACLEKSLKGQISNIQIIQGYICSDAEGKISNLHRGGSDYTASLLGSVLKASEVQIWTDIDGMHNNDPRFVGHTEPVAQLSFDEAAELAYFGAKILHPASIWPAQKNHVPVRLLNTMDPSAKGTIINDDFREGGVKSIAAKDNITAIKIKSGRMLLAYGFLRKVFEIFEKYETAVDMITTSEVAVSLTIDETKNLEKIEEELLRLGTVHIDSNQTIVCIVGDMVAEKRGIVDTVFSSLSDIPLRMISYGGSKHNISILIDSQYKRSALQKLNKGLFDMD
ncbi:MAG: aspartate kinase [Bacteroidota bacterium]